MDMDGDHSNRRISWDLLYTVGEAPIRLDGLEAKRSTVRHLQSMDDSIGSQRLPLASPTKVGEKALLQSQD